MIVFFPVFCYLHNFLSICRSSVMILLAAGTLFFRYISISISTSSCETFFNYLNWLNGVGKFLLFIAERSEISVLFAVITNAFLCQGKKVNGFVLFLGNAPV